MKAEGSKSLVSIETKLPEKVYSDILSDPGKKVSKALATICDTVNTILYPLELLNEKRKIILAHNVEKFKKKLESVAEEDIVEVPSEISQPIVDRLTYVTNETISEIFCSLLANASNIHTASTVHPAFIHITDRITPDEAKIIRYLYENEYVLYALVKVPYASGNGHFLGDVKFNLLAEKIDFLFPDNVGLYLDNLLSAGIIYDKSPGLIKDYSDIHNHYSEMPEKFRQSCIPSAKGEILSKPVWQSGTVVITDFGLLFSKACLPTKKRI